jgi:hypothetical protein
LKVNEFIMWRYYTPSTAAANIVTHHDLLERKKYLKRRRYKQKNNDSSQQTIYKTRVSPSRRRTRQHCMMEHIFMPRLIGITSSDILANSALTTGDLIEKLETHLPPHFQGYDWKLLYNLSHDGSCLDILMHKVDKQKGSIILIETTSGKIFGAFAPVAWKKEATYYGKGEAFVFICAPEFQRFTWKRTNTMFMMSNNKGIGMGGGGYV